MSARDRNFFAKEFRDYHYALGYQHGLLGRPKESVPKSRQAKYDAGYELGKKDQLEA